MIIDLHTHTLFSDGVLIPYEHIQRAKKKGYGVLGLTDHADFSNYQWILENLLKLKEHFVYPEIKVIIGIEITHVPPIKIAELAFKAKEAGAEIIVAHGESLVEPVEQGTNQAAIEAGVDILAHPGLLSRNLALQAKKNNVLLEITARKGHNTANGHIVKVAKESGAFLAFNSDAHSPSDLFQDFTFYQNVALGSGLSQEEFQHYYNHLKKRAENFNNPLK